MEAEQHISLRQEEVGVDPKRRVRRVDHPNPPQDDDQDPAQDRMKERESMSVIGHLIIGLRNIITIIEIIKIETGTGKGTMIEIGKEVLEVVMAEGTEIEYRNNNAKK